MDASNVKALHDSMRKYGIPGIFEPVDPKNHAGDWRVVDPEDRQDITESVLARVAARDRHQPTRGFVIAG
ncbi:hypothetical protein R1T08_24065 [Streptomyces sp. SBC-4]|nr:hypothetical protein [Streptomyces sp. SBC-4]MDV5147166.1 hypothetical protein [Streptomyces sp. SBC-4]